jgi:hypothetical protein
MQGRNSLLVLIRGAEFALLEEPLNSPDLPHPSQLHQVLFNGQAGFRVIVDVFHLHALFCQLRRSSGCFPIWKRWGAASGRGLAA